jgi:hypothetical protein
MIALYSLHGGQFWTYIPNIVDQPKAMASEIYGLICSTLVYKLRNQDTFDVTNIYKEFERTVIEGLKGK